MRTYGAVAILLILTATLPLPSVADFTIATFNAEFLVTDKVHVKFGLNFAGLIRRIRIIKLHPKLA